MNRRTLPKVPKQQQTLFDDPDLLRKTAPCVYRLEEAVAMWRKDQYPGITAITRKLLNWWFRTSHQLSDGASFHYYQAQQEAIETLIYIYEVAKLRTQRDLLQKFAPSYPGNASQDREAAPRYCIKMATGSGKTKVMALAIVWHYCNVLLGESPEDYANTFLILAPNVIVLERLKDDFLGGRIFQTDPLLPDDIKYELWDLECVMRGETRSRRPGGTLLLTNIQQFYQRRRPPAIIPDPLAELLTEQTTKRSEAENFLDYVIQKQGRVLIINDEAHHAYNEEGKGWRKIISDVASATPLISQLDFSATPREKKGELFPWTIFDYPLRKAIIHGVVKRPYRGIVDFKEDTTSPYASQKYKGFLVVAIERWREYRTLLAETGKRPLLFIMLGTTEEADEVGYYLRDAYPDEFGGNKTLIIHTGDNGEINESDLEKARRMVREVDHPTSEVHAIVSVLMLREGWDVQNVTVVVGLRPFTSRSQILPEQTIGRGMRLMFHGQQTGYVERVDITGNAKFLEFLDQLEHFEDIAFATFKMQKEKIGAHIIQPVAERKAYDIVIPRIGATLQRKQSVATIIASFNMDTYPFHPLPKRANEQAARLVRLDLHDYVTDEKAEERDFLMYEWKNINEVIGNYARLIAKELHIPAQFARLVPKIRDFLTRKAFGDVVKFNDPLILQTLGRKFAIERVRKFFVEALGQQLIEEIEPILHNEPLRLSQMPTVISSNEHVFEPKKCILSYVPCTNTLERDFGRLLDRDKDIRAWCKLDERFSFTIQYLDENYNPHLYHPDFVAIDIDNIHWVIETKGQDNELVKRKDEAAIKWCSNATRLTGSKWHYIKVSDKTFRKMQPEVFYDLIALQPDEGQADYL